MSTDLDPSRCPDCGHYWPAHFANLENGCVKMQGCQPNAAVLRAVVALAPVTIRRSRHGPLRGHTIVTFRDCRDPSSGTVLTLDLDTETYHELAVGYVVNTSVRLGGLDQERAKDRLEEWLGYAVRVVGR